MFNSIRKLIATYTAKPEQPAIVGDDLVKLAEQIPKSGCGCYRYGARDFYAAHAKGKSAERVLEVYAAIEGKLHSYCEVRQSNHTSSNASISREVYIAAKATFMSGPKGQRQKQVALLDAIADDWMQNSSYDFPSDDLVPLSVSCAAESDYETATLLLKPKFRHNSRQASPRYDGHWTSQPSEDAKSVFSATKSLIGGYRTAAVQQVSQRKDLMYTEKLDRLSNLLSNTGYEGKAIDSLRRQKATLAFKPDAELLRNVDWICGRRIYHAQQVVEKETKTFDAYAATLTTAYENDLKGIDLQLRSIPAATDTVTQSVRGKISQQRDQRVDARARELDAVAQKRAQDVGVHEQALEQRTAELQIALEKVRTRTMTEQDFLASTSDEWIQLYHQENGTEERK